jgi:hypothetical protein
MHPLKKSDLLFDLTVICCILSALATVASFLLYIRARMTERNELPEKSNAQNAGRFIEMDRRENRYRSIHFITLFLFVLLGVLILVQLSARIE